MSEKQTSELLEATFNQQRQEEKKLKREKSS